jgi:hypothetical protein
MNVQALVESPRLSVAAALIAACAPHAGMAQESGRIAAVPVGIFAAGYVASGQVLADLDAVEARVQAVHARAVRLVLCDPAATGRLLAAGYRLRHLYLEIDPLADSDSACKAQTAARAIPVGIVATQPTDREDPGSVDRYWRQLWP